jgi:hypothetical protein
MRFTFGKVGCASIAALDEICECLRKRIEMATIKADSHKLLG